MERPRLLRLFLRSSASTLRSLELPSLALFRALALRLRLLLRICELVRFFSTSSSSTPCRPLLLRLRLRLRRLSLLGATLGGALVVVAVVAVVAVEEADVAFVAALSVVEE